MYWAMPMPSRFLTAGVGNSQTLFLSSLVSNYVIQDRRSLSCLVSNYGICPSGSVNSRSTINPHLAASQHGHTWSTSDRHPIPCTTGALTLSLVTCSPGTYSPVRCPRLSAVDPTTVDRFNRHVGVGLLLGHTRTFHQFLNCHLFLLFVKQFCTFCKVKKLVQVSSLGVDRLT